MNADTLLAPRLSAHGIMRRTPGGYEVTRTEDGRPADRRTFAHRAHALTFLVLGDRVTVLADG